MIVEYAWSNKELIQKKCFQCDWLKMHSGDDWYGICECPDTKVQVRQRCITDKKCSKKKITPKGQ